MSALLLKDIILAGNPARTAIRSCRYSGKRGYSGCTTYCGKIPCNGKEYYQLILRQTTTLIYEKKQSPKLPGWVERNKIDHLEEYGVLLQMAPYPSLIIERVERTILVVNSPFLELTAFSQKEILSQSLEKLIADIPTQELNPGDEFNGKVSRKNRPAISLKLRTFPLDQNNDWIVLTTGAVANTSDLSDKGRKSFIAIGEIFDETDTGIEITKLVQKMTEALSQVLQIEYAAVYLKNDQPDFKLIHCVEPQTFFPAEMSKKISYWQKKSMTWQHGERRKMNYNVRHICGMRLFII